MADIAFVFHWTPEYLAQLPIGELWLWRDRAVSRFNKAHAAPET